MAVAAVADETRSNKAARERAILREAARWLAREDLGTVDQKEFEAWRGDPRHALAYARVSEAVRWATLAVKDLYGAAPSAIEDLIDSLTKPR